MAITKTPGVYFDETVTINTTGDGSKIPVFIGKTGNTGTSTYKVDGTVIHKYKNYTEASQPITDGGIGTDTTTNPLLQVLEDFFEEAEPVAVEDIGVSHIYVIDVGNGTSYDAWETALTTAKTAQDAYIEAYIGLENITDENKTLTNILSKASRIFDAQAVNLELKNGFYTKLNATDTELITLSNQNKFHRIHLLEPYKVGKSIARICVTPYNIEVGFLPYRSVDPGEFIQRSRADELLLQNSAVIFNHDEYTTSTIYPKMNLCMSSQYTPDDTRPADSLFHARYNADTLLRQIFDACYPQVKANETSVKLAYIQSQVDAKVDAAIERGDMIGFDADLNPKGTRLQVYESESEPYFLEVRGNIQPVNSTIAINVKANISAPIAVVGGL